MAIEKRVTMSGHAELLALRAAPEQFFPQQNDRGSDLTPPEWHTKIVRVRLSRLVAFQIRCDLASDQSGEWESEEVGSDR
jgi:hypothetical protein